MEHQSLSRSYLNPSLPHLFPFYEHNKELICEWVLLAPRLRAPVMKATTESAKADMIRH
jgi:hypothetical protein